VHTVFPYAPKKDPRERGKRHIRGEPAPVKKVHESFAGSIVAVFKGGQKRVISCAVGTGEESPEIQAQTSSADLRLLNVRSHPDQTPRADQHEDRYGPAARGRPRGSPGGTTGLRGRPGRVTSPSSTYN
jgi:hypothetical protein